MSLKDQLAAFKKARKEFRARAKAVHKALALRKKERLSKVNESRDLRNMVVTLLADALIQKETFTKEAWVNYRRDGGRELQELINSERNLGEEAVLTESATWVASHEVLASSSQLAAEELIYNRLLRSSYTAEQQHKLAQGPVKKLLIARIERDIAKGSGQEAAEGGVRNLCDELLGLKEDRALDEGHETRRHSGLSAQQAAVPIEWPSLPDSVPSTRAQTPQTGHATDKSEVTLDNYQGFVTDFRESAPPISASARDSTGSTLAVVSFNSPQYAGSDVDAKGFHNRPRPDLFPGLTSVKWEKLSESTWSIMNAAVATIRVQTVKVGEDEVIRQVKLARPDTLKTNVGLEWVLKYVSGNLQRQRFWLGLYEVGGGTAFDMNTAEGEEILATCAIVAMGAIKDLKSSIRDSSLILKFAEQIASRLKGSHGERGRRRQPKRLGRPSTLNLPGRPHHGTGVRRTKKSAKQCYVCYSYAHETAKCPARHGCARRR